MLLVLLLCSTLPSFSVHQELAFGVVDLQTYGGSAVSDGSSLGTTSTLAQGDSVHEVPGLGWWAVVWHPGATVPRCGAGLWGQGASRGTGEW